MPLLPWREMASSMRWRRPVAISGLTGTVRKDYDGTTQATLRDGNFSKSGLVNNDVMAAVSGTYASKDAATGVAVTAASGTGAYAFTDASGTVPVYGYGVTGTGAVGNVGVIDPKQLGITIVNNPTKTYKRHADGNADRRQLPYRRTGVGRKYYVRSAKLGELRLCLRRKRQYHRWLRAVELHGGQRYPAG